MSLFDLICKVPRFMELVPAASLTSLSATSSGLHKQVQAFVSGVLGVHHTSFDLLISQKRPLLKSLDLTSTELNAEGISVLIHGHWPVLRRLKLAKNALGTAAISVLIQADWPAITDLNLGMNDVGADAIQLLSKAKWPLMRRLDFCSNRPNATAVQHLVSAPWFHLESLNLCCNLGLGAEAAHFLSFSHWPLLRLLCLRATSIGVNHLPSDCWPQLKFLHLANSRTRNVSAQQVVRKRVWPQVKYLDLSKSKLDSETLQQLVQDDWPGLETLNLSYMLFDAVFFLITAKQPPQTLLLAKLILTGVSPSAAQGCLLCHVLGQAHLPALTTVDLGNNCLDAEAFEELLKGDWRRLKQLDLAGNELDATAIGNLVQADMRSLEVLFLGYNHLEFWAVLQLAKGRWPLLKCLSLLDVSKKGHLTTPCVQNLLKGDWPCLETLALSVHDVCATAYLLNGNGKAYDVKGNKSKVLIICSDAPQVWPCLKIVDLHHFL